MQRKLSLRFGGGRPPKTGQDGASLNDETPLAASPAVGASPGSSSRGSHGLFPVPQIAPTAGVGGGVVDLDIIVVHGITGDPFRTFTHENGFCWMEHVSLPGSRVFTFGYDASIQSRSVAAVEDWARCLLVDINEVRRNTDSSRRIIFICHSLGGLVVKQVSRARCSSTLSQTLS